MRFRGVFPYKLRQIAGKTSTYGKVSIIIIAFGKITIFAETVGKRKERETMVFISRVAR